MVILGGITLPIFLWASCLAASRLLGPVSGDASTRLRHHAVFLFALWGVLYLFAIGLGSFGLLHVPGLLGASLACLALCWRGQAGLLDRLADLRREIADSARVCPLLVFVFTWLLAVHLASPVQLGDSLAYHLPNIHNFVTNASTVELAPDRLYDPSATTTYYLRGAEAVLVPLRLLPGFAVTFVFLKLTLFLCLLFLFRSASRNHMGAALLVAVLASMELFGQELGNYKNDLQIAVGTLLGFAMIHAGEGRGRLVPALVLVLLFTVSNKMNATFYIGLLGIYWMIRAGRAWWQPLAWGLFVIAPLGLYFLWVNWFTLGSPLHPFGITLAGHELFPGFSRNVAGTSILGNLDRHLPLLFLRGLVRQCGPLGALFLGLCLLRGFAGVRNGRKAEAVLLLLFCLVFVVTPFSDRNAGPHNQLYSGHTIRMALPAILLSVFFVCSCDRFGPLERVRKPVLVTGLFVLFNLFWFDLICLFLKPGNAFFALAPVLDTFSLPILAGGSFGLVILCGLMAWRPWRWVGIALLLAASVGLRYAQSPDSLSRTFQFKMMNETSGVFPKIATSRGERIAIYNQRSPGGLTAALHDVVMRPGVEVFNLASLSELPGGDYDLVIVVAPEEAVQTERGRSYRVRSEDLPESLEGVLGYEVRYRDTMYVVFKRAANPGA